MTNSIKSLVNETISVQRECKSEIDRAFERYARGYENARKSYYGQALQDECNRLYSDYTNARNTAISTFDKEFETAFKHLVKFLELDYAIPPANTQVSTLNVLNMRKSLNAGDVQAAVTACGGSIMSTATLRDLVRQKSPNLLNHVPEVPNLEEVKQTIEKQKAARIESMHSYLDIAPGQTDAKSSLHNYLFDPESGLSSFFDAMDAVNEVLNGGKE